MSTRVVAALVGMGILVGLLAGLLIGALAFRPAAVPPPPPVVTLPPATPIGPLERQTAKVEPSRHEEQPPVDTAPFVQLADRVCKGQESAVQELLGVSDELYRDMDFNDSNRVRANFVRMTAAYERIGQEAGKQNLSAMAALQQSLAEGRHVRGFAANALGTAAAMGNEEALEILLHHDEYGILKSSAVGALARAASEGNPRAIDFLAFVLEDERARPLWNMAADGLRKPALAGNQAAAEALQRYNADPRNVQHQ